MTNEIDIGSLEKKEDIKLYDLVHPSDPRVKSAIAPFSDDMLKEHNIKDRKELSKSMFHTMKK